MHEAGPMLSVDRDGVASVRPGVVAEPALDYITPSTTSQGKGVPRHARPRSPTSAASRPERVCIIKPSSLGDVVHALPVLSALRGCWPGRAITWVVNRSLRGLLDGHPESTRSSPSTGAGPKPTPAGVAHVARFLRELGAAVRPGDRPAGPAPLGADDRRHRGPRSGSAWPTPARGRRGSTRTASASAPAARPTPSTACCRWPRPSGPTSRSPGSCVPSATRRPRLGPRRCSAGVPRPRLVLNLGARWVTKRWPPEHFAEVARRAVEERGAGLVAVGAPEDRPLVEELARRLDPIPLLDLCGRTTPAATRRAGGRVRPVPLQRHRPAPPRRGRRARVVGIYTCTSPR